MSTTALSRSSKASFALVRFFHGDPEDGLTAELYTDDQSSQSALYGVHKSVPAMEITVPEITGMLEEKAAVLKIPADDFLLSLSSGEPISTVYCVILERFRSLELSSDGQIENVLFVGKVSLTEKNYSGKSGSVRVEVTNWKGELDIPINPGIVEHYCVLSFLGWGCRNGLSPAAFKETATIIAASGKVLTVTDTDITSKPDRRWHRGTVKVEGKEVSIREWRSSDPTKIYLTREVPSSWAGKTAEFTAGCSKLYSNCEEYGNEENFLGPGFAVPAYLPVTQTGREG